MSLTLSETAVRPPTPREAASGPVRAVSRALRRARAAAATALGLAALPWLASSCDDNIACVYFTGCAGATDPDGSLSAPGDAAVFPVDGQWIELGRPMITQLRPSSTGDPVPGSTPVVLVFSESMNAASLADAFEIVPTGFGILPPGPLDQALVGDGRMLVLFPSTDFLPGEYQVQLAEGARVLDLTGQRLLASDQVLGTFTVDAGEPDAQVVASWPISGTNGQSETTEMVVVFDRELDASTVDADSFDVKLGTTTPVDPAFDPDPTFVVVDGGGADGRALVYQSLDDDALPFRLGTDTEVTITVSPDAAPMLDGDGITVPEATVSFTTAAFAAPLAANFMSAPPDAIGIANLTFGSGSELLIQVELADGEPNDLVDVIFFGVDRSAEDPETAETVAFLRSVQLDDAAPILSASFDLVDLNLLSDGTPESVRVAEGPVSFAFRVRRGGTSSPLTVLDVDPLLPGIQDPVLDTVPPVLEEFLFPSGSTSLARSAQRDLVITGRASEAVVAVEVTSDVGDNTPGGMLPEVIGSTEDGVFIARPVSVSGGIVEGEVAFTAIAYDAARNPSPAVNGTFRQLGVVGPVAHTLGDDLTVEVYDAQTFELLQGALVVTHADMGNAMDFPYHDDATTGAGGTATVGTPGAPSVGTILTVDMPGYDLFTYHGVAASRISVPLVATGVSANASVLGNVVEASEPARVALEFGLVDSFLSDSRRPEEATPTYGVPACEEVGDDCGYGPESIRPDRLGAQTFVAGDALQEEGSYSAADLVQAFDLRIPTRPTAPGQSDETFVNVPFLLDEPGVPSSERPLDIVPIQMVGAFTIGIDSDALVGDDRTTGDPFVTVESTVPGVPGAVTVGLGIAFPQVTDGLWVVRAAYAGAVSDVGFFGSAGVVDSDPFVRAEMRDMDGNRAGHRPRRSTLATLPGGIMIPGNVPLLFTPPAGGSSGGEAYAFILSNAFIDLQAVGGLYRVSLRDDDGRGWTLWKEDGDDASGLTIVAVPDLTDAGSSGLSDGTITCQLSSFGWPTLDTTSFLWADVEREYSIYSHSAPVTFSQP